LLRRLKDLLSELSHFARLFRFLKQEGTSNGVDPVWALSVLLLALAAHLPFLRFALRREKNPNFE
jgi:hypothetical protein